MARAIINPWTTKIKRAWESTLKGFIDTGRLLADAKKDLGRGEWTRMVERDLPFGMRFAQMLMKVASDNRLRGAKHVSRLPRDIGALYQLTSLKDDRLRDAFRSGEIHSQMTRKDAVALARVQKVTRIQELTHMAGMLELERGGPAVQLWYVDPPWRLSYEVPYPTMSLEEIRDLRMGRDGTASTDPQYLSVSEASASNSAIAMWAVEELLHEAEDIIRAWGFRFILPRIIWDKGKSHTRAGKAALYNHEYLLIGTRGPITPLWKRPSVLTIERTGLRHSQKPDEFYFILEEMFPHLGFRVELFSRRWREGWSGWGNEYLFEYTPKRLAQKKAPARLEANAGA